MSGKPNPEGVRKLAFYFREYNEAREKMERLQRVIENQKRAIEEAQAVAKSARDNIEQLMAEMDVHAPGNFGYEGRLFWLLKELSVQTGRCEVGTHEAAQTPASDTPH